VRTIQGWVKKILIEKPFFFKFFLKKNYYLFQLKNLKTSIFPDVFLFYVKMTTASQFCAYKRYKSAFWESNNLSLTIVGKMRLKNK
jgi:hypothetical protein